MPARDTMIRLEDVSKSFTIHLRGGAVLPVVQGVSFEVKAGECVVLGGPSGIGKSSILKMIYGSYRVDRGLVWLKDAGGWVDVAEATPLAAMLAPAAPLTRAADVVLASPRRWPGRCVIRVVPLLWMRPWIGHGSSGAATRCIWNRAHCHQAITRSAVDEAARCTCSKTAGRPE